MIYQRLFFPVIWSAVTAVVLSAAVTHLLLRSSVFAQVPTVTVRQIKTTLTSQWNPSSPDPSGIAYWPAGDRLIISDGEVDEMPLYAGTNIYETLVSGHLGATSTTVPYSNEPTGLTIDGIGGRMFMSDDVKKVVFEIHPGTDGRFNSADDVRTAFSTTLFGSNDPEGVVFVQGKLFIAGGLDAKIYQVDPGANGQFDGIAPAGDDAVMSFDTAGMGESSPEGIEYVAETNSLYIIGTGNKRRMLEISLQGQLQRIIDISVLSAVSPAGLAWGRSSIDPQKKSMYIVDRGIDNNANPAENDGKLYEIALDFIPAGTPTPTDTFNRRSILYTVSTEDFSNPERGFMKQSSIYPDQPLDPTKIRAIQPSDSVVWIYFRLDNYRSRLLDQNGLATIRDVFTTARNKGLKLVIRFIYNWGPGSTSDPNLANPDAPLALALQHIDQLKPILVENSDVIVALQAGFVGHWGEWHSSAYLYAPESKKAILDALLAALPKNRMLMVRYPRYKELFFQGPVTPQEAFSETDRSRIGHHNDCFLSDATDEGTYRSKSGQAPYPESVYCTGQDPVACWKGFISQDGRFAPVGGETCRYNPPRTDCPTSQQELELMHWSFINNDYQRQVLDGWVAGGCMDTIRRRLGYRLVLQESRIPPSVSAGGSLALDVILKNVGFASLFNPRPVFVVLEGNGRRYDIPLSAVDPRRWEAGSDQTISMAIPIPATVVAGRYRVGLWLPDEAAALRTLPAYAVRFANVNVWDAASGINVLTDALDVHAAGDISPTVMPTVSVTPPNGPGCVVPNISRLECYEQWRQEYRGELLTKQADYTADGAVTLADYELWRWFYTGG